MGETIFIDDKNCGWIGYEDSTNDKIKMILYNDQPSVATTYNLSVIKFYPTVDYLKIHLNLEHEKSWVEVPRVAYSSYILNRVILALINNKILIEIAEDSIGLISMSREYGIM